MPGAALAETVRNEIAAEVEVDVLERFLRYVRVDTQSDPASTTYPSTAKQRDLGELLAQELKELGLADAAIDGHSYVFATVPGSAGPTVGLIAHVDTSPDESSENVDPQVVRGYDGGDLQLPGDPRQAIRPSESTLLADKVGHDIVTSDGRTLLGADDKAGVAEIMAAVAYLIRHPEIDHAPIRVAFTVDEASSTSTSRRSAPTSPTRSTARRSGGSTTRRSRRPRSGCACAGTASIPAPRRARWSTRSSSPGGWSTACRAIGCPRRRPTTAGASSIPSASLAAPPRR